MRRAIELGTLAAAVLLAALAFQSWRGSRDDQLRLQATLASQKQLLDAADAREHDRATSLKDTLAQIEALKHSAQTPEQILRELQKYLPLPQPISLAPATNPIPAKLDKTPPSVSTPSATPIDSAGQQQGTATCSTANENSACKDLKTHPSGSPSSSTVSTGRELPSSPIAQIPGADLKPLYDFVQDCRACQAQLASAKLDATDNATKIGALTRERDAAIKAAKGGTFWLRLRRNALWFAAGAAGGAVALCVTVHCRP